MHVVADALSRRYTLIAMLETKLFGFDHIKRLYVDDRVAHVFSLCLNGSHKDFFVHDSYLFKGKCLCVPKSSL